MSTIENVSRRGFLKGVLSSGALVLAVRYLPKGASASGAESGAGALGPLGSLGALGEDGTADAGLNGSAFHPNIWVGINTDGTIYIVAHRSEMGTGIRTSLPLVLADEMEADWTKVKIEQAIGDAHFGSQDTDGSQSIRGFFDVMRQAGATARTMLVQAAAAEWKVPASECEAELHTVIHRASGKKLGYGELAVAAAKLPVPAKEDLKLKPQSRWRYIGKGAPSYDIADLCTGKAGFGMDAKISGMVYASIEHPPVLGGQVKSVDDKEALKVAGVRQTVAVDPFKPPHGFQQLGGVAVIADNTWAAFQGRRRLKVEWDNGANAVYNSTEFKKDLQDAARKSGKVARNVGDVDAAFAKGGKTIEAEYYVPHLAHASMEPPAAVADFRDGKVVAWAPTQNPQAVQDTVAKALGIPKEAVTCNVTLLGGGFGRKSMPDYVAEAAILSKKVGKPVKVVWSREDDIKFDYYHAVSAMYMKAAVDSAGRPSAWLQRSAFTPITSSFAPGANYGSGGELGMGWVDIPFDIPNLRVENGPATAHVRIGWLRSVANIYHAFAIQSFANALAVAAGRDPVDYLLELIGKPRVIDLKDIHYTNYGSSAEAYPIDTGRIHKVVEMAAEKSGWGKRKMGKGSGMGIAVHRSFVTTVASVVEVEVTDEGKIIIPRVDTVVDAGLVVNPIAVKAQFEGAAVFGTSIARTGEITATGGKIDQSNFHNYKVSRMADAPRQTNVYLIENGAAPGGVGEPGVPPFVPALCNAIYAATGKQIRELPLSKHKLGAGKG
jgi:isoquinoline 1-oxidoreductase beta subunit